MWFFLKINCIFMPPVFYTRRSLFTIFI